MSDINALFAPIKKLHEQIRAQIVDTCERLSIEKLSSVARDGAGDTIFAIDGVSEELLIDFFETEIASIAPVVLIAEAGWRLPLTPGERPMAGFRRVS